MISKMVKQFFQALTTILLFCLFVPSVAAGTTTYKINAGDILEVFVWNEAALSSEVLVQPDGLIRFPMVGQVMVGGRSPADVEVQIITGLKKYLKDEPVVTVSLRSINGNKIYVLGNVARPGEYVVNNQIDVMQALALAGGLTSFAAENDVRILRRDEAGKSSSVTFPYARVKQGKDLSANVVLRSGDTVVVP
jgi:polysaccharide export outer membrane protein